VATDEAALAALEHRVRQRILRALAGVVSHTSVVLNTAARADPGATAGELLSRADVHHTITAELARAASTIETAVRAGYLAGARLGDAQARAALRKLGHTVTNAIPDGGDYLQAVADDVNRALSAGLPDIQQTVGDAIDGVGGRVRFLRRLTVHAALRRVARRLYVHASAAAAVAVHRGFSDAQAAAWAGYNQANPFVQLVKTWHVRGPNPCASCLALDGTTVGANEQFDRSAGAPDRILPAYRDLYSPPRHPNCRCKLSYEFAPDPRLGPFVPIGLRGGVTT
jgi:hypothetical protein